MTSHITTYKILGGITATISLLLMGSFIYVSSTDAPAWERTERVFVYGTLTNPAIRILTCRCHTPLIPATLDNYRKEGLNIVPDDTQSVRGGVIAVSPKELARLDRYERVPERYRRTEITIAGQTMWVYIRN